MTKKELVAALVKVRQNSDDTEVDHSTADDLLLEYINDPEVSKAYHAIEKWYA